MTDPKHVGVTDISLWTPTKRDALLFDHIVVGSLEKGLSEISSDTARADWDYLASEGYILEYDYDMSARKGLLILDSQRVAAIDLDNTLSQTVEKCAAVGGLAALYAHFNPNKPPQLRDLRSLTPALNIGSSLDRDAVAESALQLLNQLYVVQNHVGMPDVMAYAGPLIKKATIRSAAAELGSLVEYTAVSIIPEPGNEGILLSNTTASDCFRLVIQSLPVPDELTPWDDILQFRRDEHTQAQLRRLKRWMRNAVRRLATEDVNFEELQDELAEYIDGYTEYMRINKLKTSTSALETIITTGAEILESALKLKLATLAKSLFQVRHQQIALMEAELNAPGREVAYIVSAHEQFSAR